MVRRRARLQGGVVLPAALPLRQPRRLPARGGRRGEVDPAGGRTAAAGLPRREGHGQTRPIEAGCLRVGCPAVLVLNFYSPLFIDQLRKGRKSATIRLGDK